MRSSKTRIALTAVIGVYIAAVTGTALLPITATAQTPGAKAGVKKAKPGAARGGRGRMARLARELKLTDAQKAKIAPILKEQARQVKVIQDAHKKKVLAVLTPEQRTKLAALEAREKQAQKTRQARAAVK